MTARIIGALFVDLGEGREIKHGDRAGHIRWRRLPSARFECLLCGTAEFPTVRPKEPVPAAVRRFIASIREDHRAQCPATTTHTERQAA
ncbi:hypothetical protein ACF068_14690 [Streptomyces sp. NPDC016309]|uniref:hypothetical protein n=1 Tax=Streptomyces sp. NPDC016309 TaxID=3364965 RepID=UPI0036FFBC5B